MAACTTPGQTWYRVYCGTGMLAWVGCPPSSRQDGTMRKLLLITWLCWAMGSAETPSRHRILFNRFRVPEIEIMIAGADGKNERVLAPHGEIEYSPSYSPDGQWVVFTRERGGLADIYRIHPDGTGLERL